VEQGAQKPYGRLKYDVMGMSVESQLGRALYPIGGLLEEGIVL